VVSITDNNGLVQLPAKTTLRALRRLQALVRKPPDGAPHGKQMRVPPGLSTEVRWLQFSTLEVDAVGVAVELVASDLCFEHLDHIADKLWHFAALCAVDRRADHVKPFVEQHAKSPETVVCRVAVEHLQVKSPIDVLDVRFAPLDAELASGGGFSPSIGAGCQAEVEVTGTSPQRMADRARDHVARLLRVARVAIKDEFSATALQLRFEVGRVVAVGPNATVTTIPEDNARPLTLSNERAEAVHSHPVASLRREPANTLEQKADVALHWLERSSLTADPLVSMLYLFFALEALLGDKSNGLKGAQLAFRRALLGQAVTEMARIPSSTLLLYEDVRNDAVHGTAVPAVDRGALNSFDADVRLALREYLELAQKLGITDHAKLMRAIDGQPAREDLAALLKEFDPERWAEYLEQLERDGRRQST
jgi:hypothetical protein